MVATFCSIRVVAGSVFLAGGGFGVKEDMNIDGLSVFYLTMAIIGLAFAVLMLPTLVHGPKKGKK